MSLRNLKLLTVSSALICFGTPAFGQMAGSNGAMHATSHTLSYPSSHGVMNPMFQPMPQSYNVDLNKTQIIQLNEPAGAVVVGNPAIADVSVHSDRTIFIIGRGYGETNVMILSPKGDVVMDASVQVTGNLSSTGVRVYNGSSAGRQTFNCTPYCIPAPILGDQGEFRTNNEGETIAISNQIANSGGALPVSVGAGIPSSSELSPGEF